MTTYKRLQNRWVKELQLKVGDKVKIMYAVPDKTCGWDNTWLDCMTDFVGKTGEVTRFSEYGIQVSIGDYDYNYPFFVLKPVRSKK